ncbi:MAG TPA: hypothetical protein VMN36_15025 [Verrucomicrobiales bacterium]|nr:hypothetical protein [Verrucomicrobiales bacterium]
MPEPLSVTAGAWLLASHAALTAYGRGGSAVSPEAAAVQRSLSVVVESTERSQALFGQKSAALSELFTMAAECAEEGWDGASALPLDPLAVSMAGDFIRALPDDVPLPEFAPEPDGSVSLDWIDFRHRRFSLSISESLRLAYAWLDGSDTGHGVAGFDGANVPRRILEGIRAVTNHAAASFRAS